MGSHGGNLLGRESSGSGSSWKIRTTQLSSIPEDYYQVGGASACAHMLGIIIILLECNGVIT
jgi:hypothetical protein